jgi:hypothetical protein
MNIISLLLGWFLLLISGSAFATDIKLTVTNELSHPLYISARNMQMPEQEVYVIPSIVSEHTQDLVVHFTHVIASADYFEVYFGRFPNDEICTFAYEFPGGLAPAECSDFKYKFGIDRNSVKFIRSGALGEIRTPDHLVRSQVLYPTELRAHI